MEKHGSKYSSREAISLIDEQLQVLTLALGAAAQPPNPAGIQLKRKNEPALVISAISAADSGANAGANAAANAPIPAAAVERVLVTNAMLAIASFLADRHIDISRAPEIQFLSRARDAIRNGNIVTVRAGEPTPEASFGGLKIDASDDGAPLFCDGDGDGKGVMCSGDAVALMRRVAEHLRGMRHLFSAGDAG